MKTCIGLLACLLLPVIGCASSADEADSSEGAATSITYEVVDLSMHSSTNWLFPLQANYDKTVRVRASAPITAAKVSEVGSSAPTVGASPTKPPVPSHVTRLTPEERKQTAERIAAAHAARVASSTTPRPSLPAPEKLDSHDLDHVSTSVLAAMKEAIPFLAECYKQHGHGAMTAAAMMTLTGDPDIGTVIDADQITEEDGKPLDPKLDDCLRGTMQTLALPPLTEGDKISVKYSFKFDEHDLDSK